MSRRLFQIDKRGQIVGPRQYYAPIAGRDATKPRLRKKAAKFIELSETAWREALNMKEMILHTPHTFDAWNKQRKVTEKLRSVFWKRRSFSRGLKEGYDVTVEYYTTMC